MHIHSESRRAGSRLCGLLVTLSVLGAPSLALAQTLPDAPSQLSVDNVDGHFVTLTWDPPVNDRTDGYVVEGGFAPDSVAGSIGVGPDTTSVTVPLPSGVYFIRTYAVVEGQRSQPSNEVQVAVAMQQLPSAPDNLTAVAVGQGVAVRWRTTFNGGAADHSVLEFDGPVSGSFVVRGADALEMPAVPDGTYSVWVRSVNDAGTSSSTDAITISVPGAMPVVTHGPERSIDDDRLPVRFEHVDTPRLTQLREREQLEAVIAGAATEFEAILKLRDWVAAQFPHTSPDPYPPWDALIILDEIRAGRTGGFCGQYSQVLLQALASLGIPARYLEIGTARNPINHFPIEVWSNDFGKWVLLDADFNLHYERNGLPLSAVEVHDAYVSGQASTVTIVAGTPAPGHPSPSDLPERTFELYYYLRYALKADHVSQPYEAAFDRFNDAIEFLDERTTPWELSPEISPYVDKSPLTSRTTTSRTFVDASINQVWLSPTVTGPAEITVALATNMPDVAYAEYRVVDRSGNVGGWQSHSAGEVVWQVAPGDRSLEVRAVNRRAIAGPVATVSLVAP